MKTRAEYEVSLAVLRAFDGPLEETDLGPFPDMPAFRMATIRFDKVPNGDVIPVAANMANLAVRAQCHMTLHTHGDTFFVMVSATRNLDELDRRPALALVPTGPL